MHNRPDIDPARDIVADMIGFFEQSLALAAKAGVWGRYDDFFRAHSVTPLPLNAPST